MALLTEVPYRPNSAVLFEAIADRPWSVFLDSGRPATRSGRYDILTADPMTTLVTRGTTTLIQCGDRHEVATDDPFSLLSRELDSVGQVQSKLPFDGGAIGWFGYDLARRLEQLPNMALDAENLPEMAVGIYDWALVVDHQEARSWLVGHCRDPRTRQQWWNLLKLFCRPPKLMRRQLFQVQGAVVSNFSQEQYATAFERIKHYIREGDCYQVNLAQRFSAQVRGDLWLAYQQLRALNPAPFAVYLNTPFGQVLSSSPERFLRLEKRMVETKPIKGTRPRGTTVEGDSAMAMELTKSPKDQAENLMIVDLLRSDLGRVCEPGSVTVPKLFAIESYATVHHLVSTVQGRLGSQQDAVSLLRACFPGGSITGAPKIRAMEIIEELEPHRRGIYCGSVAYIGFNGAMDSNITIRTLIHNQGEIRCWAGGGIVHDSQMAAEYQETFDKAAAMLRLLQQEPVAHVGS